MTTRTIRTPGDIARLATLLAARDLPVTVSIRKGVKRTTPQNRLSFQWFAEIAEQLGDRTVEDVRAECKLTLGIPILRAEDEAFRAEYDEKVMPLAYETKLALMVGLIRGMGEFPVTRLMTRDQESRFLDAIWQRYTAQGVVLTQPERAGE